MRDLTQGAVGGHVLKLSAFIALSSFFQTLYLVVDLYFVGRLGTEAVAGVAVAGNLMMVVLALTMALGVGATSFIAQALGRQDRDRAALVFNQTMAFSTIVGIVFFAVMMLLRRSYSHWLAADDVTAARGIEYLNWFIPALAVQFLLVGMGSALRGAGDLKVPTMIQIGTVLLNVVLSPILMFGWWTGWALGVAGASVASFISIVVGAVAFVVYFRRPASKLRFRRADWTPRPRLWGSMLKVGAPVGGEFSVMTAFLMLVYSIARPFGAEAQAGFGIGMRIMQSLFLPAVSIGFATAPVAGQNFGAGLGDRVRHTFVSAARMAAVVMLGCTALCQVAPESLVAFFNPDPAVVAIGAEYLRIVSWTFPLSGVIFVASSVFQGMGHTLPALASSLLRFLLFAPTVYWWSLQPGFEIRHIWFLSVATILVHVAVSLSLLYREFGRRLTFAL